MNRLMPVLVVTLIAEAAIAKEGLSDKDLVVEVVDEGWLPVPGIEVIVTREDTKKNLRSSTDRNGEASFSVLRGPKIFYRITAQSPGFERAVVKHVRLGTQEPTPIAARVQMQLRVKMQ